MNPTERHRFLNQYSKQNNIANESQDIALDLWIVPELIMAMNTFQEKLLIIFHGICFKKQCRCCN